MMDVMQLKRIWAMFNARNKEFFRDRAAFGWNFAFPFLIIVGFGIIFGGETLSTFKVGVFPHDEISAIFDETFIPEQFQQNSAVSFIAVSTLEEGLDKIHYHKT